MIFRRVSRLLRRTLREYFVIVVSILLILVLLGAVGTYAAQDEVYGSAAFEHSATVEGDNPFYENDTELTNQTTYFTSVSPELNGRFVSTYDFGGSDEMVVDTNLTLVVRSVPDEPPVGTDEQFNHFPDEFWRESTSLTNDTSSIEPGEPNRVGFTVDVADVIERTNEIDESLGEYPGEWELLVVAETTVVDPDDNTVVTSDREVMTVLLRDNIYTVTESGGLSESADDAATVLQRFGPPGLLVASLVALGAVLFARHRNVLAPPERDDITAEFAHERDALDDWISIGTVNDEQLPETIVDVRSLRDLVDVGIDTDRRVIEDRDRGAFYVLDGDVCYTFTPGDGDPVEPIDESSVESVEQSSSGTTRD